MENDFQSHYLVRSRDNPPHSLSGVELLIVVAPRQRCSVLSLIVLSICATVVLCGGYPLAAGPTDFGRGDTHGVNSHYLCLFPHSPRSVT